MKPFDLEAAKRGAPITTRDGRSARFVGHVPEAASEARVVAYISGEAFARPFYEDGLCDGRKDFPVDADLFMASRTLYVNLYDDGDADWFTTEAAARHAATAGSGPKPIVVSCPVEI